MAIDDDSLIAWLRRWWRRGRVSEAYLRDLAKREAAQGWVDAPRWRFPAEQQLIETLQGLQDDR